MENNLDMSQLVFPRDKTSHSTSWDNLGEDVPGQKYLAGVKNSRTNTSTITTWLAKKMSKKVKNCIFLSKFVIFLLFFPGLFQDWPRQAIKIPTQPFLWQSVKIQSCPGLSHGEMSKSYPDQSHTKIMSLSFSSFFPGQWRNFCSFALPDKTVPSCWKP